MLLALALFLTLPPPDIEPGLKRGLPLIRPMKIKLLPPRPAPTGPALAPRAVKKALPQAASVPTELTTLEPTRPLEGQTFEDAIAAAKAEQLSGLGARGVLAEMQHTLEENVIPRRSQPEIVA